MARARPERLLDEVTGELQAVETLNCLIERTETPPFYRLTAMRKASSHSDGPGGVGGNQGDVVGGGGLRADLAVEKGTIHTKRHSGEEPIKTGWVQLIFFVSAQIFYYVRGNFQLLF